MISVAMTTYNAETYLEKQLDSLLKQTVKIDEIVIVDDGSSDRTKEILNTYKNNSKETLISLYFHETNLGYVQTFKEAIEHTSKDVIFLCDHDDIWYLDKIEQMMNIFALHPEINCLATAFDKIDENDNELPVKKSFFLANDGLIKRHIRKNAIKALHFKDVFTYNAAPGCCIGFKKILKDEILGGLHIAPHDYLILCLASSKKNAYFYNHACIKYRLHKGNTIGLPNKDEYENRLIICKKDYQIKLDLFDHLPLSNKEKKYALKHLKLLKNRVKYLESKKKFLLFLCAMRSFIGSHRYYLTLIKDVLSLKGVKK